MSIAVHNLTKIYGVQRAVDNLTFTAEKGKITGFLGPNGAGKSTTMKMAMGYLTPNDGDIVVDGISIHEDPMTIKRTTGYLPENNPLYLDMYVKEFLTFTGKSYRISNNYIKQRVTEIIEQCGLGPEANKKIRMLSKGYRQRVGLAKALLPDPKVLILDEPTTGLDPNQIIEIRELIKAVGEEKTVILSTHILPEVEAICDKVVIINKGQLKLDSSVDQIRSGQKKEAVFVVEFQSPVDSKPFADMPGVLDVRQESEIKITIKCDSDKRRKDILKAITDKDLPMVSIRQSGDSLEEVFKNLTTREESGE